MKKVSYEELTKIASFIASCNAMINGKFILADVKILKILKEIADSDELYHFISECLIGFDFEKEFHKAEIKNRFNGGVFKMPDEIEKKVALTFSLLVEFDSKRLDFYRFINDNFINFEQGKEYYGFAQTVLVPFRDIIANEFGLLEDINDDNKEDYLSSIEVKRDDDDDEDEEDVYDEYDHIERICDLIIDAIKQDFKIKIQPKENMLYIIEGLKYSLQYRDMRLVSSFVVAFDCLVIKSKTVLIFFKELKELLEEYYSN